MKPRTCKTNAFKEISFHAGVPIPKFAAQARQTSRREGGDGN
jgi:hypothetical protein